MYEHPHCMNKTQTTVTLTVASFLQIIVSRLLLSINRFLFKMSKIGKKAC